MCGKHDDPRRGETQTRIVDGMSRVGVGGTSSSSEAGQSQALRPADQLRAIFDLHEKMLHLQLERTQRLRKVFVGLAAMSPENGDVLVSVVNNALMPNRVGPF